MAEDNEGTDDINTKEGIEESKTVMDDADKEAKVEDSIDVEKEKKIEVKAEEAAVVETADTKTSENNNRDANVDHEETTIEVKAERNESDDRARDMTEPLNSSPPIDSEMLPEEDETEAEFLEKRVEQDENKIDSDSGKELSEEASKLDYDTIDKGNENDEAADLQADREENVAEVQDGVGTTEFPGNDMDVLENFQEEESAMIEIQGGEDIDDSTNEIVDEKDEFDNDKNLDMIDAILDGEPQENENTNKM